MARSYTNTKNMKKEKTQKFNLKVDKYKIKIKINLPNTNIFLLLQREINKNWELVIAKNTGPEIKTKIVAENLTKEQAIGVIEKFAILLLKNRNKIQIKYKQLKRVREEIIKMFLENKILIIKN